MEGRFRHLMPKSRQDLGKAGSQVILKCLHFRQSGARSGISSSGNVSAFICISLYLYLTPVFDILTLFGDNIK